MRGFGNWYKQPGSRFWWIQFWKNGKRQRQSTGSEKLKDAQELLKSLYLAAQKETVAAGSPSLLISDLYAALERDYVMSRRKTLRNIKQIWQKHLQGAFGHVPANELRSDTVDTYIVDRQTAGAKNATINRELASLKRMYKLAKIAGKIKDAPHIRQLKERNVRKGFVKDAQYEALARETGKVGLWMRAMFEVGYSCGWRKSELLNLRVRQVDLMEQTISLDPGETKNDEGRLAEITDSLLELVRQCVVGKGPNDFVFTRERESNGRKTKRIDGRIVDFRDDWKKVTEAAGCPGLLFHDLRRSAVRNMDRDGIAQKEAMAISGHRTASVYQRYNIMDRSRLSEVRRKMQRGAQDRRRQARQQELFDQGEIFPAEQQPHKKPPVSESEKSLSDRHSSAIARPN